MKKAICLALSCLTALSLFTGCSGTMYSGYGSRDGRSGAYDWNGNGNVSTNKDGTVNGGENSTRGKNPHRKISGDMFRR